MYFYVTYAPLCNLYVSDVAPSFHFAVPVLSHLVRMLHLHAVTVSSGLYKLHVTSRTAVTFTVTSCTVVTFTVTTHCGNVYSNVTHCSNIYIQVYSTLKNATVDVRLQVY